MIQNVSRCQPKRFGSVSAFRIRVKRDKSGTALGFWLPMIPQREANPPRRLSDAPKVDDLPSYASGAWTGITARIGLSMMLSCGSPSYTTRATRLSPVKRLQVGRSAHRGTTPPGDSSR